MDPLTTFLASCHDEDERVAREAISYESGRWVADDDLVFQVRDDTRFTDATDPGRCPEHPEGVPNMCDHEIAADAGSDLGDDHGRERGAHIARHDPQSVLARVEAERSVVAAYWRAVEAGNRAYDDEDNRDSLEVQFEVRITSEAVKTYRETLRALAYGYRTRPGWQPAWRPDGVEATTDA